MNAATLAIIDAGIPIKDYVCACSVSLVRDTPLIDINHLEESSGSPYINLALLPNYDQIAKVFAYCNNSRFYIFIKKSLIM